MNTQWRTTCILVLLFITHTYASEPFLSGGLRAADSREPLPPENYSKLLGSFAMPRTTMFYYYSVLGRSKKSRFRASRISRNSTDTHRLCVKTHRCSLSKILVVLYWQAWSIPWRKLYCFGMSFIAIGIFQCEWILISNSQKNPVKICWKHKERLE